MSADTSTDLWQYRESMRFTTRSVDLTGFQVVGPDGPVGTVDRASNDVRVNYVVVDTGDWLPGRHVMLPAGTVERIDPATRTVHLRVSRETIRQAPEFDKAHERSARFQDSLTGYYHGLYDTGL